MELRAAQMNNEPTVEQRERDNLFRVGNCGRMVYRHGAILLKRVLILTMNILFLS